MKYVLHIKYCEKYNCVFAYYTKLCILTVVYLKDMRVLETSSRKLRQFFSLYSAQKCIIPFWKKKLKYLYSYLGIRKRTVPGLWRNDRTVYIILVVYFRVINFSLQYKKKKTRSYKTSVSHLMVKKNPSKNGRAEKKRIEYNMAGENGCAGSTKNKNNWI